MKPHDVWKFCRKLLHTLSSKSLDNAAKYIEPHLLLPFAHELILWHHLGVRGHQKNFSRPPETFTARSQKWLLRQLTSFLVQLPWSHRSTKTSARHAEKFRTLKWNRSSVLIGSHKTLSRMTRPFPPSSATLVFSRFCRVTLLFELFQYRYVRAQFIPSWSTSLWQVFSDSPTHSLGHAYSDQWIHTVRALSKLRVSIILGGVSLGGAKRSRQNFQQIIRYLEGRTSLAVSIWYYHARECSSIHLRVQPQSSVSPPHSRHSHRQY